ncbi:glycosyltransferase family 2 protein [candidate division KSB1 bacterium]|nr:glycosyltransferase family 2 protein [candidate division KSB1 bacterium]
MNDINSKPLISVIIPTFKRSEMLDRAIRSILNQTYKNTEIIVVDDNNEQDQFRHKTEILMQTFSTEPRLRYIRHQSNLGGAAARNTGIDAAQGDYISFLDDDEEYFPEKIAQQVSTFLTSPIDNLGIVYCGHIEVDTHGKTIRAVNKKWKGNVFHLHLIRNLAPSSTLFMPKSVLVEAGGFRNLSSGQEYDLIFRILRAGYNVDVVDKFLVKAHIHDGERISSNIKKIEGSMYLYEMRKEYFHLLSKAQIRKLNIAYYLSLSMQYSSIEHRQQAKYWFGFALKCDPLDSAVILQGIAFITGIKMIFRIKQIFHRLKYFWFSNKIGKNDKTP